MKLARLQTLLEPVVEGLGYECVGVEFQPVNGRSTLCIYIDSEEGVTVDDCERVSRQASAVLDVEDVIRGHYTLEVSSPGLDRPLFTPAHYRRFIGSTVHLRLHSLQEGRRNIEGRLSGVDADDSVRVTTNEGMGVPGSVCEHCTGQAEAGVLDQRGIKSRIAQRYEQRNFDSSGSRLQ
ncbi:MAG: ribosome maturation factor RimP [Gammaproteobacteria bacterium]